MFDLLTFISQIEPSIVLVLSATTTYITYGKSKNIKKYRTLIKNLRDNKFFFSRAILNKDKDEYEKINEVVELLDNGEFILGILNEKIIRMFICSLVGIFSFYFINIIDFNDININNNVDFFTFIGQVFFVILNINNELISSREKKFIENINTLKKYFDDKIIVSFIDEFNCKVDNLEGIDSTINDIEINMDKLIKKYSKLFKKPNPN